MDREYESEKDEEIILSFCGKTKSMEFLAASYERTAVENSVLKEELDKKIVEHSRLTLDTAVKKSFAGISQLQKIKQEIKTLHAQINDKKSVCYECLDKGKKKVKDPNFKCVICEETKLKNKPMGDGVKRHIGNYQHKGISPFRRYPVCQQCDYFFVERPKGKAPDFIRTTSAKIISNLTNL
ncbi:11095_t:CDS:2 [Cetraspora pellucida]|nr:11095_t:CDS:2 [Cetraspora pellucida]